MVMITGESSLGIESGLLASTIEARSWRRALGETLWDISLVLSCFKVKVSTQIIRSPIPGYTLGEEWLKHRAIELNVLR